MKTLAVMCIALTRQRPSRTPLALSTRSTSGVMFTNPRRPGTFIVRYSVCDFIGSAPRSVVEEIGAEVLQPAVAGEEGDGRPGLGPAQEPPGRGEIGAGGEAGEDPLLGREIPRRGDRLGIIDLDV